MDVQRTHLPGVLLLRPVRYEDARGSFSEVYRTDAFDRLGLHRPFVQDNRSVTRKRGLRGLHFQLAQPQAKLVRVEQGRIFDVVVDIRVGSPMFGRYLTVELSEDDGRMLYIPAGLAHGFQALSSWATVSYKVDDFYSGSDDQHGIRWDDLTLDIRWPLARPVLSDKDAVLPSFADLSEPDLPAYEPEP